jgi:hypothetical protein
MAFYAYVYTREGGGVDWPASSAQLKGAKIVRTGLRIASALLGLSAGAALASDGTLNATELPGFVIGYTAHNDDAEIHEFVPQGETVQVWTRMVTVMRFDGTAKLTTPTAFNQIMIGELARSCPGATVSAESAAPVEGRPAARFRADCPRNPATGQPEILFHLAIAGPTDLHIRQVSFRYLPGAKDVAWAEGILAQTRWCAADANPSDC